MKVMEDSIQDKDSTIEMVTPPRKKMKQARLPFQMVGPLGPSSARSNKKRKLDSPSPIERKSPRTGKGAKKENLAKRVKGSEVEIVHLMLTDDEEDIVELSDSSKTNAVEVDKDCKESNESNKDTAAKGEEKVSKDSKTEVVMKKKDYGALSMFLKKAQSKEGSDDIQLLAMSDYESGNSKDSDASSKNKVDNQEVSAKELNSKTETENSPDCQNHTKRDENAELKSCENENEAKTDEDAESKSCKDENEAASLETKDVDVESTLQAKDGVTSDDNDVKNIDSDSDICPLSTDEDEDDERDKSSNENGDKDKSLDGNDGSKTPGDQKSSALKNRKLTPKQIERRLESAKKREEKLRMKQEREKKREEERESRRKEKEEKRREKEEKDKVEKEQKRKEKEMKDLKKQVETEQKQKEKEAKEEERRKREEEKLEAERKKQKAASNFANFFVPKKQEAKAAEEESVVKDQNFMPFEVKVDMRVAPLTRRNLNAENKLTFEGLFKKGVTPNDELYLNELKQNRITAGRSEKTWPYEAKDDVVVVDEDDCSCDAVDQGSTTVTERHHPKLFLFAENRRPPFWGTWRKQSDHINPRRPFAKDSKWFDYDVDSDDEWEEEEPGESIRGSDDERDEEGPEDNEYDVDNDFMVPHGYLSDEEAKADEEDGEDMSPETQKLKLKLLGEQFEAERKTKTSKIKPKVIGCIWQGSVNAYPENTAPNVVQILRAREAWVGEIPIAISSNASSYISESLPQITMDCGGLALQTPGAKKKRVPEEVMPDLIRLVHGNINGRIFLIKEFMAFWEKNKTGDRQISKLSLSQKIKEIASWIACPEEGPMHLRSCWYVREDVRKEYNCMELTLPNRWEYSLRPTRKSDIPEVEKPEKIEKEKKRIPLITQFTKKITQEEMKKQLASKPTTSVSKTPKRAALISVPRGEQFQRSSRDNLVSQFVTKTVETREIQFPSNQQIPVVEIPEEIHNVVDSDRKITDLRIENAVSNAQTSLDDKKLDETPSEVGNSEDKAGKEVAGSLKSMDNGEEALEAGKKSPVAEPMETEEDGVIILLN